MPHIIIEHSKAFDEPSMLNIGSQIQEIMANIAHGNFDADQCKIRTISYQQFKVGLDKNNANFIHISIKILAGRALEIRQELAQKTFDLVEDFYRNLNNFNSRCDISIDIVEMDRNCYKKITIK
ncbi:MAG: hypothetical protein EBT63_01975 [Proteobacteria bacterium]|jgi:5-carboxymethyl-2-hydroxymuconate isomerase|nr:hypothetical protein [Pseudomonadota bacterium]NCA27874.1 hypothetical protein [Pseudomonadota bacterium]